MRRLSDRFTAAASACTNLGELKLLIEQAAHELGFDYFALLHHSGARFESRYVRIDNYPSDWVGEWLAMGFDRSDPVHHACMTASTAFTWRQIPKFVAMSAEQRLILRRAAEFGLKDGFTVPLSLPGEPAASCSFAVRLSGELPHHRLACVEQLSFAAFSSARRLQRLETAAKRPRLSRRQLQCLRLIAGGKSDWEIAAILGISLETARQYAKTARAAYGAVSRAQLAVLALEDQQISFEEIALPRGPSSKPGRLVKD